MPKRDLFKRTRDMVCIGATYMFWLFWVALFIVGYDEFELV